MVPLSPLMSPWLAQNCCSLAALVLLVATPLWTTLLPQPTCDTIKRSVVPFDPAKPERLSVYGVTIGQRLEDIERAFPDQWQRGYSREAGFHLYRMPNAPEGKPGLIASAGDSMPNDGIVKKVLVFAFNPQGYLDPSVVTRTLEMAWGTAIHFEGSRYARMWVDLERGVQANLRFIASPDPPQLQITISQYCVPEGK